MKLIHCADVHLDSAMQTHMPAQQASRRNMEILHTFVRLTQYAAENGVRAVILAGDVFDTARVRQRTADTVLDAMAGTPDIDYLYLPGNHDEAARVFSGRTLPENLRLFDSEWNTFRYGDTTVSGRMLGDGNAQLYDSLPHAEGCVNLVTLHGQVGAVCGEDRINLNLLKNRGIDYLALGHLHSFSLQKLDERGVFCYSGCLEGRGFDECGEKGFVLLDIVGGRVTPEFVPFAARQLHRVETDITGCMRNAEIAARMKEAARDIPPEDMAEFLLTGSVSPETDVCVSYLQDQFASNFFFAKVKDETRLNIDPEQYRNDVSLKGEFIRQVLGSELDEHDKAAVIRAGLQALAGEEISL